MVVVIVVVVVVIGVVVDWQCTTSQSVSAMIGMGHFGTIPCSVSLILYCLYGIRPTFSVSLSKNSSRH